LYRSGRHRITGSLAGRGRRGPRQIREIR
jgi:hypothetical protein